MSKIDKRRPIMGKSPSHRFIRDGDPVPEPCPSCGGGMWVERRKGRPLIVRRGCGYTVEWEDRVRLIGVSE